MTASNRTTLAAMALGGGLAIAGFAMARTDDFLRARLMAYAPPSIAAPAKVETVKAEMVKAPPPAAPKATCPSQEIHARRAPRR